MSLPQAYTNENMFNNKIDRLDLLIQQYEDPIRAIVHRTLEEYVERAFNEFIGDRIGKECARASDGKQVLDYRNGYRQVKQVTIDTLSLSDFRLPRNRAGGFSTQILEKAQRLSGRFSKLALELFVNGVSTRKVRRVFEKAGVNISGLSKSTVSDITRELINEYTLWINRPIRRIFRYIQVDGVYVTIRKSSKRRCGTLIVIGITEDGCKEVLHFTLGSECERNFDEILQNLIRRGLDVNDVWLVTADGAKGPINSIIKHFGRKKLQRCVVHKTRNVLEKCPSNIHDELKAKLGRLWNQSSKMEALEYFKSLEHEYGKVAERSVACIKDDLDDLLRFYDFSDSHRKTIRCTNLIERVIHEVRRRTKVMNTIDSEFGCYGITMGIVREQNERWSHRSHWKKS